MNFTEQETEYLASQRLARLATVQADGTPQVSPVGFSYRPELGVIDIGGFDMSRSQKFRNVLHEPRVALVVDDIVSLEPWRVRCLEIRGVAEALVDPAGPTPGHDGSIIRVHPRRVISFGIDQADVAPHLLVPNKRNVS